MNVCAGAPDGWVYFIRVHRNLVKIGWSRRPDVRLRELSDWYTHKRKYRLRLLAKVPAHREDEYRVLARFAGSRTHLPGWENSREEFEATAEVLEFARLVNNNRAALLGALGMAIVPPHSSGGERCS